MSKLVNKSNLCSKLERAFNLKIKNEGLRNGNECIIKINLDNEEKEQFYEMSELYDIIADSKNCSLWWEFNNNMLEISCTFHDL